MSFWSKLLCYFLKEVVLIDACLKACVTITLHYFTLCVSFLFGILFIYIWLCGVLVAARAFL